MKKIKPALIALFAVLAVVSAAPSASATPLGTLTISNCDGGGVVVNGTSIDWLPAGGGTGCIVTGTDTLITYSGGTLGPSVPGVIKDLTAPTVAVDQFMTFPSAPTLDFALTGLGPSVATSCAGVTNYQVAGQACSVGPTSPFLLVTSGTGTTVILAAHGIVTDLTGSSLWQGSFSTEISSQSPAQITATILGGGAIRSTESGHFDLTATPVPEPASLTLLGTALLGAAAQARKRRRSA